MEKISLKNRFIDKHQSTNKVQSEFNRRMTGICTDNNIVTL